MAEAVLPDAPPAAFHMEVNIFEVRLRLASLRYVLADSASVASTTGPSILGVLRSGELAADVNLPWRANMVVRVRAELQSLHAQAREI